MKDSAEIGAVGGNWRLDFGGLGLGFGEIMPTKMEIERDRRRLEPCQTI